MLSNRSRTPVKSSCHAFCPTSAATLSRTVLTSVTTLLPVVALIGFCSGDIRGFGVCMLIGLVTSTFSSIFVASPVMLAWYRNKRPDFRKGADK